MGGSCAADDMIACVGRRDAQVLMSLDRYLAIVHPVISRSLRTQRNTVVVVGFMWPRYPAKCSSDSVLGVQRTAT